MCYDAIYTRGYTYESHICFEENINYNGNDIGEIPGVATADDCQLKCKQEEDCNFKPIFLKKKSL